jgi:hypothetical protein
VHEAKAADTAQSNALGKLLAWIRSLEDCERERMYASGYFGVPDEDLEYIAGA